MMNLIRLLRYLSFIISVLFVISLILPFNPDEIYKNQSVKNREEDFEITLKTEENQIVQNNGGNENKHKDKKMFVILVTGFRTGSTFLGELFNQNPNALYLFEPFHQTHIAALMKKDAIHKVSQDSSLLEQRTAYLEQIVNNCQVEWSFFGGMSTMMKCGNDAEENLQRFGTTSCDKSDKKWDRACEKRNMVVFKLIRLQRIQHLELVPGIKDANVYVIHLIRDPRGTMNSRIGWGTFYLDDIENLKVRPLTPEKMGIAAANLCDREWENIEFTKNLPDWLKERFLRVTHDDMSLKPVETAEKVYQFIGKKIPDSMSEFLLQHTSSHEKGVLNTSRNSTEVLAKWHKLDLSIIRAIEDKCKNVMDYMGYEPYNPDKD